MLMKNHFFFARTHITVFQRLAMALAIAVFGGNAAAQEIQAGGKNRQLVHDGVLYEYKATPIPASASDPVPSGYMGKIYVTRQDGTLEFSQETRGGGALAPGCDGDFPAISLIDIPHADGSNPQTYVIFCGSDLGLSNTLMFYKPGAGMVGTLFFGRATPVIYRNQKFPETLMYKRIYLESVCSTLYYPTLYGIHFDGSRINLDAKTDSSARKKYAEMARNIKFHDHDFPKTDAKGFYANAQAIRDHNNRCLQPDLHQNSARKLVVTHLAGMHKEYCDLRKYFEGISGFVQEVELKTTTFLSQCGN